MTSSGGARAAARRPGGGPARLEVTERLTVHTAADQAIRLLGELADLVPAGDREVVLDLSAVPELDTAGVQLVLLLRRELRARGWRPALAAGEPVTKVLALAGLGPDAWQEDA